MTRSVRLDQAGLLHHVMIRGIDKLNIFIDDKDRDGFIRRVSRLLLETETACFAWVPMNNHAHVLLRPQKRNWPG